MKRLYLDINGVLLTPIDDNLPEYSVDFVGFVTQNFDCYWLTGHCQGETETLMEYLADYYPPEVLGKLSSVKPTSWEHTKAEAIDFESDFIWVDDAPTGKSKDILRENNCLNRLVVVDLDQENELLRVIELLGLFLSGTLPEPS
jgi:hypothetical protein